MTTQKQTTHNKRKLFEGLRHGDLKHTIDANISIDRYKSKIGDDDQVVVLGFKVMNEEVANDLVSFIESGYNWVLDANKSPATDSNGKVTVFVEFNRRTNAPNRIMNLLYDINHLTEDLKWTFSYYKQKYPIECNEENLKVIPTSPKQYRTKLMQEQELDDMMMSAGLDPSKRYKKAPQDPDTSFLQSLAGINKKG